MTQRNAMASLLVALALLLPADAAQAQQADRAAAKPVVRMYATDWCPYCRQARAYFARHAIPYAELDIEKSPAARFEYESVGGRGIPLILVGSERINGFSEPRVARALKAAGY